MKIALGCASVLVSATLASSIPASGQECSYCAVPSDDSTVVSVLFNVSESSLDKNFRDNSESIAKIKNCLDSISDSESLRLKKIRIVSAASPDSLFEIVSPGEDRKGAFLAVRTNLLYDIAGAPNIAIEFPIRNRWSVAVEHVFPWWIWSSNSRSLQILYPSVLGRYWWGNRATKNVLTGPFAGLQFGGGKYDIEPHHKGWQGEGWIGGPEIGYAWELSRHWHFEVSAGAGIMWTHYRRYHGMENDKHLVYQYNGHYTWVGPIKANASIAYLFYRKAKPGRASSR